MNFSLHWITSLHLRPHEPINFLQKMVVILCHFSFRKPDISSIFWEFLFWAFSPMIFQTLSIGFISGLWKWTMSPTPTEEIIPNTITPLEKISVPLFTSYKPLTIRSKQVEFRFITKVNHIPLFLCPHDMLCGKIKTNLLIFLWNQRFATWKLIH